LTSTAAAMHRNILQRLGSPVYLIEEAGELLESQVLACLHKNVQHLIMIGDEAQLRPKVNSFTLESKYNFAISMFERLVKSGIRKSELRTQLRMRPQISELIKPFYDGLQDHQRVFEYPNVSGVVGNVCFISHKQKEDSKITRSKSNTFEANFVVNLTEYLLHQPEYSSKDITIITPYKGQMFLIRTKLWTKNIKTVRVVTVDDYQVFEEHL
jgi:superfamily I DNA and/or RNA helicase